MVVLGYVLQDGNQFEENALTQDASETLPPGLSSTVSSPDSAIQKEERTISRTREEDVYTLRFGRCGLPIIQIPSNNSCRTPRVREYQAKNRTDTVQRAARRDRPSKRGIAREFDVGVHSGMGVW